MRCQQSSYWGQRVLASKSHIQCHVYRTERRELFFQVESDKHLSMLEAILKHLVICVFVIRNGNI